MSGVFKFQLTIELSDRSHAFLKKSLSAIKFSYPEMPPFLISRIGAPSFIILGRTPEETLFFRERAYDLLAWNGFQADIDHDQSLQTQPIPITAKYARGPSTAATAVPPLPFLAAAAAVASSPPPAPLRIAPNANINVGGEVIPLVGSSRRNRKSRRRIMHRTRRLKNRQQRR
jgi:hypothetical protein